MFRFEKLRHKNVTSSCFVLVDRIGSNKMGLPYNTCHPSLYHVICFVHWVHVKIYKSWYSQSSPCDHSHERPALVMSSIVTLQLRALVSNHFCKWPQPLLFLSSRKRPLSQCFNESIHFLIKFRVMYNISTNGSLICTCIHKPLLW